ncbi:hypothetical protein RhiirB3_528089 [Rhizophagus irregularis]|nr:hypothetical protein RhiirB3_528089 [Rhizophagus irregularis]
MNISFFPLYSLEYLDMWEMTTFQLFGCRIRLVFNELLLTVHFFLFIDISKCWNNSKFWNLSKTNLKESGQTLILNLRFWHLMFGL